MLSQAVVDVVVLYVQKYLKRILIGLNEYGQLGVFMQCICLS